jgi:hypothetical protein
VELVDIEASSRIELEGGGVLTRCDQCKSMHAERNPPTVPPCEGCTVDLMPENRDAAEVYLMCRRQYVTRSRGMEGDMVIDISIPAIKATMDALGVEDQGACLVKVQKVFHFFLAERSG